MLPHHIWLTGLEAGGESLKGEQGVLLPSSALETAQLEAWLEGLLLLLALQSSSCGCLHHPPRQLLRLQLTDSGYLACLAVLALLSTGGLISPGDTGGLILRHWRTYFARRARGPS